MSPLEFNRRTLLRGLAALGASPALLTACGAESAAEELWLSAHGDDESTYGVALLGRGANEATVLPTGFRGHDLAHHPTRPERVVMFGRRPGRQAVLLDVRQARILTTFDAAPDHSMMGHGFFSADGHTLYTTEAHEQSGAGALVARSADDGSVLTLFPTGGIGPHQGILMPDGERAAIANGGILTRPESGREKLNLDSMRSSLVLMELDSGRILSESTVAESKSSIRHIEAASDGTIALGVQLQRSALEHNDIRPLVGIHRPTGGIELFEEGLELMGAMNDYVGSVAVCSRTRVGAFSSPRGNLVAFWDIDSGTPVGTHQLSDVSGVTVTADESAFVLSSSTGEVRLIDSARLEEVQEHRRRLDGVRWDNHLITVSTEETTS